MFKNISFNKYLWYLNFLKLKTKYLISSNSIEFIISHFNEDFDYLNYLPSNQKITIYLKGNPNLKLPKNNLNIKIVRLNNIGKEYHSYIYHIIKNYNQLSNINFFFSASFLNLKNRTRNFAKVYKKVSSIFKKKFKGVYTSEDKYFLFKFDKLKILEPHFRIFEHETSNKIKHKLIESKIYPLEKYFFHYFKNKKLEKNIRSLNGIFAVNKENIYSIDIAIYKTIIKEYNVLNKDYESGHYLERLYPSIFNLN
ncbi:DUF3431 domain-containing protein [Candidatus Pelagibacter sp. HIMB1485]|uniref:DUF3431 domain-containing protein n=1 Tax=Candidatus Pelagibacter sp. HIMB1485 TaxID=3415415 RepID=UPI003F828E13